ncbi:MAG: bile acid:sodium symporter [Deltaproteobacteria bacterium]|nr:bile acid:sodium symporter [Deltaproteobacteria bacterium]
METLPTYVKILTYLFVIVYMLSVTLETTRGQIMATFTDRRQMGRALLANFVLVPLLGVILARLFTLSPDVRIGFLLLALSPGGLFALQFARVSKGNLVLAVGLLIALSTLAILLTPALVALLFPAVGEGRLPLVLLVLLLLLLIAAPLLAGRAWQQFAPEAAPRLGRRLGVLSIVLFIITTVAAGKYKTPAIKAISAHEIMAIVSLVLASWFIGWLLGGPEVRNRKVLAISTSLRNVGVCLPIAVNYFPGTAVVVPILAFSGISIPMNMVFALITGRTLRDTEASVSPVEP